MEEENFWKNFLEQEFKKDYFKSIKKRLLDDINSGKKIHPNPSQFFKSLMLCKYETTKIVIVGQDPYHSPNTANGLAFSVGRNHKLPPSLRNIFIEIEDDLAISNTSGDLSHWAKQGVMLLNTSLSVVEGNPGSHSKIGWELFTDKVVSLIQAKGNRIFMLWGNHAKQKNDLICENNFILEAAHPSPLSASSGFFGCKHFSKANEILKSINQTTIDWHTG